MEWNGVRVERDGVRAERDGVGRWDGIDSCLETVNSVTVSIMLHEGPEGGAVIGGSVGRSG
jgi:hypothetical protein